MRNLSADCKAALTRRPARATVVLECRFTWDDGLIATFHALHGELIGARRWKVRPSVGTSKKTHHLALPSSQELDTVNGTDLKAAAAALLTARETPPRDPKHLRVHYKGTMLSNDVVVSGPDGAKSQQTH